MTTKPTILIVEARFYTEIADQLAEGATKALDAAGYEHERLAVPGVFEVPAAIRMALRSMEIHSSSRSYAGFIALGCVIRGETSHYDYVCSESARALQDLAVGHRLPIGYGVVTVENEAQAIERAFVDRRDKGGDAAAACLAMYALRRRLASTAG